MYNRKSQAALEFLMTYGWAILVVLVAVGALAYFGVLSPDKFLPTKCALQPGIGCLDSKVTSGTISIVLQNSLGYDMTGVSVKAQDCGASSSSSLTNGEKRIFTITCSPALAVSKYNGGLNVSYTITETGLSHTNQGTLTQKIE